MPVTQTTERWAVLEDGSKVRYAGAPPVEITGPVRTHAEADEQAAALGITFPDDVKTVKDKQAYLDQNGGSDSD